MIEELKDDLRRDEGIRYAAYKDTVDKTTIGCGRNLDDMPLRADEEHRLGCTTAELVAGRTLSAEDVDYLLDNDVTRCMHELDRNLPWWRTLPENVQRGLCNMLFNMGWTRLMGFHKMLKALQEGRYADAADEAADSAWHNQVGARAERIEELFRTA